MKDKGLPIHLRILIRSRTSRGAGMRLTYDEMHDLARDDAVLTRAGVEAEEHGICPSCFVRRVSPDREIAWCRKCEPEDLKKVESTNVIRW